MQVELKAIQRDVGITFIFVTHDQEEALTMSDRIAVFNKGRIEQVGTPSEIYERPRRRSSRGSSARPTSSTATSPPRSLGRSGTFPVRPEKIRLTSTGADRADEVHAAGDVRAVQYVGSETRYAVRLDAGVTVTVVDAEP